MPLQCGDEVAYENHDEVAYESGIAQMTLFLIISCLIFFNGMNINRSLLYNAYHY